MFKSIEKRDGRIVEFDPWKITAAIAKAGKATGEFDEVVAKKLTIKVISLARTLIKDRIPTVEEIQDVVEEILLSSPYKKTAKAYIIYRDQHAKMRELSSKNSIELMDSYLQKLDWKVNENSNMTYSLQGLNNYISSEITKTYWLSNIYPPEIQKAHSEGDFHIHDLNLLSVYCVGWDLQDLLIEGFRGVPGKVESSPAKHLRSALGQIVNFFYTLQGEAAGAQAFSNLDTLLAPFIRHDGLSAKEVKQALQEFIFNTNIPTRVGFQTPFTNVTLDMTPPSYLKDTGAIIGGKQTNDAYGDYEEEIRLFNNAFLEVMREGDAKGRVFTFPIPTYNIIADLDWDSPDHDVLWDVTAKYGIPYFSNFVNSEMKPEDVRSMCCRLRLDTRDLQKRGGGLFGANPLTGCYDDETEVLTSNGWKLFKNVNKDFDFVLSMNNERNVEWVSVEEYHEYDYNGELIHFRSKTSDIMVTPNHRMVIVDYNHGLKNEIKSADELAKKSYFSIPMSKKINVESDKFFVLEKLPSKGGHNYPKLIIDYKLWAAFMGIWLSEGCINTEASASKKNGQGYRIIISQKKEKRVREIAKLLDKLPFDFTYYDKKRQFICYSKQLWLYLKQFGNVYNKFIPADLKKQSPEVLEELWKWLVKGDGYRHKNGKTEYYWTTSKQLKDDIQEILALMGYRSTCRLEKKKNVVFPDGHVVSEENLNDCFVITKIKGRTSKFRNKNTTTVNYAGKVYCLTVQHSTLLTRRNGKINWSGNSVGIVTINLPRIGYLSKDDDEFYSRLDSLMDLAKQSLVIKRKILEGFTTNNLYPYSKFYLRNVYERFGEYWKNHFSTIGLVGMNEALMNFLGETMATFEGKKFALKVLDHMRNRLVAFQEETGTNFNLEATPAEGTCYRLAKMDRERYPSILSANATRNSEPYYTNSTQLPVGYTDDIFEALDLQDDVQTKYTGGTVLHMFLGERISDSSAIRSLVKSICDNYRLPYFTFTPTFSICPDHGYLGGEYTQCPSCGKTCEVYSRVVGYIRPVNQWNRGKLEEYKERKAFKLKGVA
ncbi:MAG: ribonucleoside triphosphate reductase [Candidatus Hermodarchaeota archaeon]